MKKPIAFALLLIAAPALRAQLPGMSLEVYGNAGFVGGSAPVKAAAADRTLLYAGALAEVGIQGEQFGGGLGLRYWEFRPTADLGGNGVDLKAFVEWRRERASHTALRLSYAVGDETFDGGSGNTGQLSNGGMTAWSIGVGHEVPLTPQRLLLFTVDVINPSPSRDTYHRKLPVLELGIGFRGRTFQAIRTLPGGRER